MVDKAQKRIKQFNKIEGGEGEREIERDRERESVRKKEKL